MTNQKLTIEDNSTATCLGCLIDTELQVKYRGITRDELTERRETILRWVERRFAACFSHELIRQVAEIQFDQLLTLKDQRL